VGKRARIVNVEAVPATPERWDDVVVAFGRRGDNPGWCWCQRLLEARDVDDSASNRESLRTEITTAVIPPGVLAYVDGVPVGWSRIMPRAEVPGVQRNRALQRILVDQLDAWWVVCFAVDQRHRGVGVATALLEAAVDHARAHGATAVEGHPVDTDALQAERVSGSALFTGTMRTFLSQGFSEIGRTYPSRPVMRRIL
jgi:GNAT superfamily N-acetyltransferase